MRRSWRVGIALGVLTLTVGAPAQAQDDQSAQDAREALKQLVPEGQPGKYDVTDAEAIYAQIAQLVGQSAAAYDFGSGSRLTGPCGGFAYS
jgi:hypothetical protein